MIDIFQYTNYRIFLKDSYDYLKEHNAAFSYRYFSQKCGYKSPNFLKLIIDGQRNLTDKNIEIFIDFFKLPKKEAQYFTLLVQFNQAKTPELKKKYASEIINHSTFKKLHPLSRDNFYYYTKWYYVAIREIIATKKIKLDAKTIASLLIPKVSESDVNIALEALVRLKLIERKDNRYIQTQSLITTGDEVSSSFVSEYHKEMLKLAADSIDNINRDIRDISALTIAISPDNIIELKSLIQKFRKNILALSDQDQNKQVVYQLGIQMFPLSKDEGSL